jgi:hypothetical protein
VITKTLHLPHDGIDEALWAAYRREDKAAVMGHLFRRMPLRISRSTSFSQMIINTRLINGFAVDRVRREPMRINGELSKIPARYIR